jgi:hypothetical protein
MGNWQVTIAQFSFDWMGQYFRAPCFEKKAAENYQKKEG